MVSVPERSKGVDSSSTVFALVGSNPTADTSRPFGVVLRVITKRGSKVMKAVMPIDAFMLVL